MDDTNKRVLIAFALSFATLMVWRFAFPPPPEPVPPKTVAPAAQTPSPSPAQAPGAAQAASKSAPTKSAPPAPAVALPVQQGSKAEEIVVESDLYRVTFSTEGAVVKSWVLKEFVDEHDKPLDVVNSAACEQLGFPMRLSLADPELSKKLNTALFVATPSGPSLSPPTKLELAYSDGKIQVKKQFSFEPGFEVRAEVSVFDGQRYLPAEVAWPGGFGDHSLPPERAAFADHAAFQVTGSGKIQMESLAPSFLGGIFSRGGDPANAKVDVSGPLAFAGLEDRYFAGIFLPEAADQAFRLKRLAWTPPDWKGKDTERPNPLNARLGSAAPKPLAFRLFVGPRDPDVLRAVNPPLDRLIDYGWFSIVAKPLFLAMHYIHDRWTHNFGWAIIVLTIVISLAMFPLKLKSIRSAQEMQKISPIVKGIQDKYKDYKFNDPRKQKMNQEIMKLYSEHHINPLGGCLPMVLQLPFLYGFYKVLDLSIELRHAPWFLWIKDLSAPDHKYILPVLMIVTMFILQKMTPVASADPAQQRMMMIMPLIFGIMFFKFASGLVLYWLTSNIVGIAQQAFINRMMPAPQKTPRPQKNPKAED